GEHKAEPRAAYFAKEGPLQAQAAHTFIGYTGYGVRSMTPNVTGQALTAKWNAFLAYAPFDGRVCQSLSDCAGSDYDAFMPRQYPVGSQQSGTTMGTGGAGTGEGTSTPPAGPAHVGGLA